IGVGMIVNGQLVRGSRGVAREIGPVTRLSDARYRYGNNTCWEVAASNAAAVRCYTESASIRKGEVGSKSDMAKPPFSDILRLVAQNDPRACQTLNHMAQHLGEGIAMLVTVLAPDVLVVVGEVTQAWGKVGP